MAPSLHFLASCVLLFTASAVRGAVLEPPNTCKVNACERAVRINYNDRGTKPAPDECYKYLATTVTPQPVTKTVTATTVVTTSATVTVDSTVTASNTTNVVSVTSTAATATFYTTPDSTIVIKRTTQGVNTHPACPAPASPTPNPIPTYASACTNDAMFSSACSCVGITKGTTKTLHPCTSYVRTTVTSTASQTTSTTLVQSVTATSETTTTISVFPTTTVDGKPTSTVYSFEPICSNINEGFGGNYRLYYSGAGYSETPNNPGNGASGHPAHTNTLSGGLTPCAAAQQCASITFNNDGSFPVNYLQFELLYLQSTANWQCTQYFDPNGFGASQYNVANPDVLMAYGFNGS